DEEVKKLKRLEKDQVYKVVYDYKSDQKREVNYIATKVEKDQAYKNVYDHKNGVPNTRTGEEVGKKLKNFFPDLWTRLFSLMIREGIDVWDRHNEKYGGDLLSNCRATLKLCILENDDLATEDFLKICRLFLSIIGMTVESKFLQHQFKYRKLEWIFKDESDDNVSSTSTNYIKFLMRFLKFIALFLDKYALNADGDVKGMFETAYSSLLKAHPDLKSLKKHSNLLESVPSNEEFKSLLRNPKNIKDCGKSVAESLIILTNRWHKLSCPVYLKYTNLFFNP
ncbi:hypothetical protein CFP56_024777, partial [Quercus suber]